MSDAVHEAFRRTFDTTVHDWPHPFRRPPRFWQRKAVARERRLNDALVRQGYSPVTQEMRDRFYEQVSIGQDIYEDAGGYVWRCWQAMLGLPFAPALLSYKTVTMDDLKRLASQGNT